MPPSRPAQLLAQSLLAVVCAAVACSSDDDASGARGSPVDSSTLGGGAGAGGGSTAGEAGRSAGGGAPSSGSGGAISAGTGGGAPDGSSGGPSGAAGEAGGSPGESGGASSGAAGEAGGSPGESGGASSGSAGTGGVAAGAAFPCLDPQPILVKDTPTGMVKCADGSRERVAVGVCALSDKAKAPDCSGGAGGTAAAKPECAPDVCPGGKYGRLTGLYYGPGTYHYCEYFCEADADCPSGSACACGADGVGLCAEAECSSTAACAAGATCRTIGSPACGAPRAHLKCIDGADACVRNQHCAGGEQCQSGSSGDSFCLGSGGCGRPILVEHVARVASLLSSTAWA